MADMWFKVDNSEWILKQLVYDMLIAHKVLQGGRPVLAVFASSTTIKVQGSIFSNSECTQAHWA